MQRTLPNQVVMTTVAQSKLISKSALDKNSEDKSLQQKEDYQVATINLEDFQLIVSEEFEC
jgi:hypothetical protein